jgi:hypothetical protein
MAVPAQFRLQIAKLVPKLGLGRIVVQLPLMDESDWTPQLTTARFVR